MTEVRAGRILDDFLKPERRADRQLLSTKLAGGPVSGVDFYLVIQRAIGNPHGFGKQNTNLPTNYAFKNRFV